MQSARHDRLPSALPPGNRQPTCEYISGYILRLQHQRRQERERKEGTDIWVDSEENESRFNRLLPHHQRQRQIELRLGL